MSKINSNKLILGTAQLEKNYGISNIFNKNQKKNAFKTLETAFKHGIKYIDTAPGYESEKIIGNFILAHGLSRQINIFTKIPTLDKTKNLEEFVIRSIENSLKNLKSDIHTLFLHNTKNIDLFKKNIVFFKKLKKIFPIKYLGFSIYSNKEIYTTSKLRFEPTYQVPFNILDQKFVNTNIKKNKLIARSIFLQGLLINRLIKKDKLPNKLVISHKKYHDFLSELNISPLRFQLSFINNVKKINKFIIGVDNYHQLEEIINCNLLKKVDKKNIYKINSFFNKINIDPRKWKKQNKISI
jgi:aryl-alcohol dehydrogenase-like predicted oxidoreductase